MFLYKQGLKREACLFNLMNKAHQAAYNALLAEEGRSLTIVRQKEWGVTGFVAPDMEADFDPDGPPPVRYKDDAFYLFIVYTKTPDSPWQAPNRAELYGENVLVNGRRLGTVSGSTLCIESGEEDDERPTRVADVVIDVTATSAKRPLPGQRKKPTSKGKKGTTPVADFTKKKLAKAKTVDEKIETAARAAAAKVQQQANAEALAQVEAIAKKHAKDIVAAMKAKPKARQNMVAFLADQLRANPEHARGVLATIVAEKPQAFGGRTIDQVIASVLAEDAGVIPPGNWTKVDPSKVEETVTARVEGARKADSRKRTKDAISPAQPKKKGSGPKAPRKPPRGKA